jgi:hypothetical protein
LNFGFWILDVKEMLRSVLEADFCHSKSKIQHPKSISVPSGISFFSMDLLARFAPIPCSHELASAMEYPAPHRNGAALTKKYFPPSTAFACIDRGARSVLAE